MWPPSNDTLSADHTNSGTAADPTCSHLFGSFQYQRTFQLNNPQRVRRRQGPGRRASSNCSVPALTVSWKRSFVCEGISFSKSVNTKSWVLTKPNPCPIEKALIYAWLPINLSRAKKKEDSLKDTHARFTNWKHRPCSQESSFYVVSSHDTCRKCRRPKCPSTLGVLPQHTPDNRTEAEGT